MEMENKVSFIPKRTIGAPIYRDKGLGIFTSFALMIFLVSVALWGGMFLYKKYLKEQISQKKLSLEIARSELEPSLITDLARLSDKIDAAKSLIKDHKTPSSIFIFLQNNTLTEVRFKDFKFLLSGGGEPSIIMSGLTKSYSILALQADVFEKNSSVKKTKFSNFKLDKNGWIGFNAEIIFTPSVLVYNLE